MIKLVMILFMIGIFPDPSAFAGSATPTSEILEAPSGVCYLNYSASPTAAFQCSGVLIAKNFLVTAAHCFRQISPNVVTSLRIQCGIKSQSTGGGQFNFTEEFRALEVKVFTEGANNSGSDFAFVRLQKNAERVSSMSLPASLESFRTDFMMPSRASSTDLEFKPDIECRSSGFGFDEKKKNNYFLTSDQSPKNGLRGFQPGAESLAAHLVINSWGKDIATFRHGDSGGAFYCRKDAASRFELIGIISSVMVRKNGESTGTSLFASTSSYEFIGALKKISREWK